jgi:hypothetical protein
MFPISAWIALGAALIIGGLGIALKVQTSRLDSVKTEYAAFRAQVAAEGKIAQAKTIATIAADKAKQEKANVDHAKAVVTLNATIKRLRKSRPSSSFVPATATASLSFDRACFDRPQLERAIREFDSGVQGLVDEGSQVMVDLNAAKEWATDAKNTP